MFSAEETIGSPDALVTHWTNTVVPEQLHNICLILHLNTELYNMSITDLPQP